MNLLDIHPLPWEVKYRPLCSQWHQLSCPHVVDANGKTILTPVQHMNHPGKFDPYSTEICEEIVKHFNSHLTNLS